MMFTAGRETKEYVCEYEHEGSRWDLTLRAYDLADAEARVKKLGILKLSGELMATIPWDDVPSVEDVNALILAQFESPEGQAEWRRQIRLRDETEFACIGNESTRQRLQSELRGIERAVNDPKTAPERRRDYWVARSTLAWCGDPEMFASPMIAVDKSEKHVPLNNKAAD